MKSSKRRFIFLFALLLTSCGVAPASASSLPFVLVTSAPNASPTPTPFQPPQVEQATPTSLYFIQVPTLEPFFPTPTASPTPIPPAEPSPTVDLSSLFPANAAPPAPDTSSAGPTPLPALTDNNTVNFLLIGSDKRTGASFRTDTMVVVILWPKEGQVSLISIPRDLWVYIPTVGMQRINTAYEYGELQRYNSGGPGLLKAAISYDLGLRIDHTAMVDFDGFRRIVDTLGGVDVPVSCPYTDWHLIDPSYNPYNENNWSLYTVQPGIVHMNGDLALWYARSRLRSSDFDRGRRQQEVLRAIFSQALKTDTLGRIPQLYNDFSSAITTDLGLADILKLALYAPKLGNANIRSYYIRPPYVSSWVTPGGADVLLPQDSMAQLLTEATTLSTTAVERQTIKVEVQNGTQNDGWDALAAMRLNYAGYATNISAADRRDYSNSVLIDMTASQDPHTQSAILNGLGLLASASVISLPDANNPIQYRLVLGNDYQPCFRPENLSH